MEEVLNLLREANSAESKTTVKRLQFGPDVNGLAQEFRNRKSFKVVAISVLWHAAHEKRKSSRAVTSVEDRDASTARRISW
jgi:hypothetical protein